MSGHRQRFRAKPLPTVRKNQSLARFFLAARPLKLTDPAENQGKFPLTLARLDLPNAKLKDTFSQKTKPPREKLNDLPKKTFTPFLIRLYEAKPCVQQGLQKNDIEKESLYHNKRSAKIEGVEGRYF